MSTLFSGAARAVRALQAARGRPTPPRSNLRRVMPRTRSVFMFNLPTILDSQRSLRPSARGAQQCVQMALVRSVQSLVATTERSGDVGGSWRVRIGLQRPAIKRGNVDQTD